MLIHTELPGIDLNKKNFSILNIDKINNNSLIIFSTCLNFIEIVAPIQF